MNLKQLSIAINSTDKSHKRGFYSKVDGLLKAGKNSKYIWSRLRSGRSDIVINWEPWDKPQYGTKMTVFWVWDTQRVSFTNSLYGKFMLPDQILYKDKSDILIFRAHATFYHPEDIDPRGRKVYWMPPAVDTNVFKRQKVKVEHDVVWVGKNRNRDVFEFTIGDEFNFQAVFDRLKYQDYINTLSTGKMILNVPVMWETNKRVMEAMAIGPALMPWGPDYTLLGTPDYHFICYRDEQDLRKKIRHYLENDDNLARIAYNGRELVKRQFTFEKQRERIEMVIEQNL